MLFKITQERPIKSLKDIRLKKKQLEEKANRKANKIKKRADKLIINTSPQLIYDEILERFDLQHSLLNMLPLIFKYKQKISDLELFANIKKSTKYRAIIIGVGSIMASLATYLYLNKKNNR